MRKILYVGHPHSTPEKEDWYQSLNKVSECVFYKEGVHIDEWGFDTIYVHSGSIDIKRLILFKGREKHTKVIVWSGDCRDELMPDVTMYKGIADIVLLACGMGKQQDMYENEMGVPVWWFPHGVAEWNFKPVNENAEGIIFIGNNYEHFSGARDRYEINKKLKTKYGDLFKIYGNGWGDIGEGKTIPFEETVNYYNNALIGIDGSIFNDKEGYFSNRTIDIMAGGCVCLLRRFPEWQELFYEDQPNWSTFKLLDMWIELFLRDKNQARLVVKAQQDYVRNRYHYDKLALKFLNILNMLNKNE